MSLSNYSTTGTKSISYNRKTQSLSEMKTKISKLFNEEYEETFNQILILSEEQFFALINKKLNLILADSYSSYIEEHNARVKSILKDLENEKKILYRKEFNYLEQQLKSFYKENLSNEKFETLGNSKLEKAKLFKNSLSSKPYKKENESIIDEFSINDLFEFIAKNDKRRNFYFRRHCIFNENHALHACFEKQCEKLNSLKQTSKTDAIKNLSLENTNFFLPLYETSCENYHNRNFLQEAKGFKTSRNTISLNTSYSNFINNVRQSTVMMKDDKYKNLKKSFNKETENNNNNKIKYLICLLCKKVYSANSVLMHCDFCSLPFYTCLQENKEEFIYPATWEKYHCGAIVNDQMRCNKCKAYLNLNTKSNKLICSCCNLTSDPAKVKWKCLVCNEDFKANAKIYNPLEFKLIKSAIKDAVLNKIPIFPEEIDCCMEIREKIIKSGFKNLNENPNEKFFLKHKKECAGMVYEGNLYNRKVVVCSECKTFVNYEKFIWFCPFCDKRYRKRKSNLEAAEVCSIKEKKENLSFKNNNNHNKNINVNNKDELSLELNKKVNSDGDLVNLTHDKTQINVNFIEDSNKNNELNEKEQLKYPYRTSNISKVINIKDKNNDKLILERLKTKFNYNNFSTNFDSFITKAVNNKRSPLFKEAVNRSVNLNFSINDIKELQNKKNPLNFSMVNNASPELAKEKTDSSNLDANKYFISSNNTNSNNDSSKNSTFKINNNNAKNSKLKIISLKGTKFDNQSSKFNSEVSFEKNKKTIFSDALDKDSIINYGGKEDECKFDDLNFNYKSTFKQETIKSKFNNYKDDLYEIIKEDAKFNDCEYEIDIGKEEEIISNKNKKAINKQNPVRKIGLNVEEFFNENTESKCTITPSVKNSKLHFNGFFQNYQAKKSFNFEKNSKINLDNSVNFEENSHDLNASGLIYNRNSLILKKNSNNKNENYPDKISPIPNLFKKDNITRVKNRIYINSVKLDKKTLDDKKKDNKEANQADTVLNISDNLYIPAKQRMNIRKDQIGNMENDSIENLEQKSKIENIQLEIMYQTEEKKDNYGNSLQTAVSDRKNSNEKNVCSSNVSNKINRYSSVNSNNNLNDLSTSSISHSNKFINCYLSKRSSENEIYTNFNCSSSKLNYCNNINTDKNLNNTAAEDSDNPSKKNVLSHQSLVFTKRHNLYSSKNTLNIANKAKDNLIQKLEEYFSFNKSELNSPNNSKFTYSKKEIMNNSSRQNSQSVKNFIYRKNKSWSRNDKLQNNLQKNSCYNLIENINENVDSEFSNSSGLVSSSQIISNINNVNNTRKETNSNLYEQSKKNSINSNKSLNINFNMVNNKEANIINEIIDEDLLELDYSCSKSRLRKSINLNTNTINKQNSSLRKEDLSKYNEFAFNSPLKDQKESKKEENLEIIFCQIENEKISKKKNSNKGSDEDFDFNEKLKNINIKFKNKDLNIIYAQPDYINENCNATNRKSILRKNMKASPEQLIDTYPSNYEIFDFSGFTYKKENIEFIDINNNNINQENSDRRKSNKKVDFMESEIIFSEQSPNKYEIKYEMINYNSPLSTKKADYYNSSVKNSIKSSSQISIVNTSQNNNYMVDEININFLIEDFTFNLDDYIMEKGIGEGSYANVFAALSKINYKKYAIKKIIVDDISHINNIVSEIKILSKFNHENIILIYGMYFKKLDETTFALYILMELAAMDWESQIKAKQISKMLYSEMELIEMLKQITSCLSFLQQNSISHRDIKPNNILIFGDKRSNYVKSNNKSSSCLFKVSDFGEARISQGNNTNRLYTIKGTELFMSPKLIESFQNIEKQVDHNPYKSDCYSLGLCLLYASSLNINSVYDIRNEIQEKATISATINKYLKLKFTNKFIDLLIRMLSIDEIKRFDFIELNEFLKKY